VAFFLCAALASVHTAFGQSPPGSHFESLADQAKAAKNGGHLDEAIALYSEALKLRPQWADGWWSLGTLNYDRNEYGAAAQAFRRVAALDAKAGTARAMLGLCEFELRQYDSALQHIKAGQALGTVDDSQFRRVMLYHEGILQLYRSEFGEAQQTLDLLASEGGETEDATTALGMAVLRAPAVDPAALPKPMEVIRKAGEAEQVAAQKKFDVARRAYAELASEFPSTTNVQYAYGRFLLQVHDLDSAVAAFKREIQNTPDHVLARLEITAVKQGVDPAGALPYAQEAVKLAPDLPLGQYLLGLLLVDVHRPSEAIPHLELARRAAPTSARIYFVLGNAYAQSGEKTKAARARATFARLRKNGGTGDSDVAGLPTAR
jgi:tetratricopeptide (TPR) repeat protein